MNDLIFLLAFAALPRLFHEEFVMQLYPRAAGCWLLLGPPYRTCRLPVVRDGLCRWHVAFAARGAQR